MSMRPFFVLWTGQALSLLGSQAVQFALIWWLTRETGSATVLATAVFVGLFPQIVLGPVIGALVDRWSRKRVLFVADAAVAVASLVLAVLFATGQARVGHVFAALFVRALGSAFHGPAMTASTTLMVPKQHLTRIQGLNQMLQGGLNIIAAPLGAILLTFLPMAGVLLVDVGSALFALGPLLFIHVPQPAARGASSRTRVASLFQDLAAGVRYLRTRTGIMALLVMAAVINLCMVPAFSLLPLLVSEELGGDALLLGWMNSALGVGMIAGGILLGVWGGFKRRILTSLAGIIGVGVAVLALGMAPPAPVLAVLGAMLALGLFVPLANGPIQAILQMTVSPELQGRVFTLMGSLAGAMVPVGLALAAPIADLLGVRAWYLVAGLVCIAMGTSGFFVRSILYIEDEASPSAEVAGVGDVAAAS